MNLAGKQPTTQCEKYQDEDTQVAMVIFFFLAALGLRCCARAFLSCGELRLLFIAVRGLLIAVPSLDAEHRL